MTPKPPPYQTNNQCSSKASEMLDVEIRPPFTMEETTHAPVHKTGCDVCQAYLHHIAEGSRNFALERYFSQKAEDAQSGDNLRRELEQVQTELSALRKENQRLRTELAAKETVGQGQLLTGWWDQHLDYGSEVYASAFAATAWSNHHSDGIRLYINQDNNMTELCYSGLIPNKAALYQWDRGFAFPGALLPDSSIATANSFFTKNLVPDSDPLNNRGGDMIRVFCFGIDGFLREWLFEEGLGWRKSSLQIKGADPWRIAAISWAEGGFAAWSLFYVTRRELVNGKWRGQLMETRCTGGMQGKWCKPVDVGLSVSGWSMDDNGNEPIPTQGGLDGTRQWDLSASTAIDGTNRRILCSDLSLAQTYEFQILQWAGDSSHTWLPRKKSGNSNLSIASVSGTPRHGCLSYDWGLNIFFGDGNGVSQWLGKLKPGGDEWIDYHPASDICSPKTHIAATAHDKGGTTRVHVFSANGGRIIQSTWFSESTWSSKPMIIRKL